MTSITIGRLAKEWRSAKQEPEFLAFFSLFFFALLRAVEAIVSPRVILPAFDRKCGSDASHWHGFSLVRL